MVRTFALVTILLSSSSSAHAQSNFYQGKTITLIIGLNPGGTGDLRIKAMMPYLTDKFGNAASRTHRYGWEAEEAVHTAREQIAALIGAKPEEIVFTSGATESDNLALKGIAWAYRDKGNHIITATTEHKAVLDSCKALEKDGFDVTYVPVDRTGLVDPEDIRRAITPHTVLISVMYVNSEIGTIGPLAAIGAIAHEQN